MKKRHKYTLYIIGALILLKALVLVDVYALNLSDPISRALKQLYPVKIVGWHMVSAYDLQIATAEAISLDPQSTQEQVLNQLVKAEKMRNLAQRLKLGLKSDAATDELTYIKKADEAQYRTIIKNNFAGRESDFVKFVAYPQAWEALLRIQFNSDINVNKDQFNLAQDLLQKINRGEKFEDLAKQYSEDRASGQLGGDLGFVEHGQLIPELEKQATISPLGVVGNQVVVTRYGYHIIYPVETATVDSKKLWHIKHILLQTQGFEEWFEQNSANIKVINIK